MTPVVSIDAASPYFLSMLLGAYLPFRSLSAFPLGPIQNALRLTDIGNQLIDLNESI